MGVCSIEEYFSDLSHREAYLDQAGMHFRECPVWKMTQSEETSTVSINSAPSSSKVRLDAAFSGSQVIQRPAKPNSLAIGTRRQPIDPHTCDRDVLINRKSYVASVALNIRNRTNA